MVYIQSLQEKTKIDNEIHSFNMMKAYQNILSQKKELKKLIKDGEERDKKILEMMWIFLSIFSLIGVNLSFFSNIKDIDIWNILLLIVVINVSLSDAIKVIFSIIRKEKVETIVEKIFRKIITCIKEKTK